MTSRFSNSVGLLALAVVPFALAQPPAAPAPDTPPATAPAPAAPSPWTKSGMDIYLLGDVYGGLNFNHPASGFNGLYNFNDKANNVHLSYVEAAFEKASGVLGFRLDVDTGRTADIVGGADDGPRGFRYLQQMYVEFRPQKAHGIQIDFGKFVTSAGAEVIESNANWNYSRSLLFAWAIPYYHFGVRATIPVTKMFSTGVQVVNGWNSIGNNNGFKTVGVVGNFTFKKAAWANTYYNGIQKEGFLDARRQVFDTALVVNPTDKASVYFNFDYGSDRLQGGGPRQTWIGFASAARFQLNKKFAFAPRAEIFNDRNGFSTGVAQSVKEITLTGEMKIWDGLISRLEYRRDMSDKPYFDRGAGVMAAKNQSTLTLAFIAFFGPKK